MKDKVTPNNIHVKFKKTEVEDHHRISSTSNKTKSVTVCNDSLKSRTSNVNVVCATCGKCVFNSNHDACVSKFLNDVNARTKKPNVVPISTRQPKSQANKFVATPPKKIVASESTIQKSKSYYRMLYEKTNETWKLWIEQQFPSGYKWVPKTKMKWVPKDPICQMFHRPLILLHIVQLILFIVDSGCTKRMTGNLKIWFKEISQSIGFITSKASIKISSQLVNFEMRIWRLLSGNLLVLLEIFMETIYSLKDIVIGLPKLKYVKDQLCSFCKVSKAKRSSFKTKVVPSLKGRLNLLHMDLCGPIRVESINGKKYILVIFDDYYRYTWTLFLRSKDETPELLKDFLKMIRRNLQAQVISVRTDKGTEFLNKTLYAYLKEEGIEHQTSTPRTSEQNDVVERRNRTLVEAARMLLSASKLPLDGENLDKMKEKGDPCILVGYSTQSKGYRVYNKRTRLIVESIHLRIDEIKEMSETCVDNNTSGLNQNDNQAVDTQLQQDEFINPLCTPVREVTESSSRNIDNSNMHTFYQPHDFEYRWTKDHPLEQVCGNPSKPVQTRRQLATDPKMCMFTLAVSTAEPKNIKEAMADSTG
ncbi:retrovirus-related pol polyprotein from transposon TNT 1-94 [Tanacetum coccineum]|uniref:Retrovirus-related pol polyprotein from transposon TNT 1-94 n=1 Tax=Tanacetum coccineum TaxID=301880 RepID=A0ABQ5CLN5_9ASTR